MTKRSIAIVLGILFVGGGFLALLLRPTTTPAPVVPAVSPEPETMTPTEPIVEVAATQVTRIGTTVEGRSIESYRFGTGSTTLLFVGGIHGGYEWNSSALAYEFITAFSSGTMNVPPNLAVVIVPNLNPDGLFAATGIEGAFTTTDVPPNDVHTTGRGRFNANKVDLNRNFDCKWQPESSWRSQRVSAGTAAFSEPEALALRELVAREQPTVAIFWHSQGGAVYGSACEGGVLPETLTLLTTYARAAEYEEVELFTAYPITGDAEGWLASLGIPAITVELATRTTTEWERNRRAMEALLTTYAER